MQFYQRTLVFVLLLTSLSFATSCSLNTNIAEVSGSSISSTGDVRVTGDGTSSSFSEDTYVEVNCNANNTQPAALEQIVRGRSTFSSTTLAYSATCTYPFSSADKVYKVTAQLFPDNVTCKKGAVEFAEIIAKGNDQQPAPVAGGQNNATSNTSNDAVALITPDNATTTSGIRAPNINSPAPATAEEFTVSLEKGWNLIGVPFTKITSEESTCDTVWFSFDAVEGKYQKVTTLLTRGQFNGKGVWVKAPEKCDIKFKGEYLPAQDINLVAGWNLISVQTRGFVDVDNIRSSCRAIGGARKYDAVSKQYEIPTTYEPGIGYWIKVQQNCVIGAGS